MGFSCSSEYLTFLCSNLGPVSWGSDMSGSPVLSFGIEFKIKIWEVWNWQKIIIIKMIFTLLMFLRKFSFYLNDKFYFEIQHWSVSTIQLTQTGFIVFITASCDVYTLNTSKYIKYNNYCRLYLLWSLFSNINWCSYL